MTLRKKTILIIGLMMLGLLGLLFYLSTTILSEGYARLEKQEAVREIERLQTTMFHELHRLDRLAHDYASWNDTYNYMVKRNADYIETNMFDQNFVEIDINLLLLIDRQGQLVWGKAYNLEKQREEAIPKKLLEYISKERLFLYNDKLKYDYPDKMQHTLMLPEGFLFIASRPILPSKSDNSNPLPPSRGTLIMARFLHGDLQKRFIELSQVPFVIKRLDQSLPEDFSLALRSLNLLNRSNISNTDIISLDQSHFYLHAANKHTLLGYALIHDMLGHHSLIIRVNLHRHAYIQGKSILYTLLLFVVLTSLLFTILFLFVFQKIILDRLVKLHKEVEQISIDHDVLASVSVNGDDEISQLAHAINQMMRTITEIRQTENLLGRIVDRSFNEVYLFETEYYRIIQANQSACKNLGYTLEELTALSPKKLSSDCVEEKLREICHLLQTQQEEYTVETYHQRKDGSLYPVEVHLQLSALVEKPVIIAIAIDISERRKAQANLLQLLEENRRLAHRTLTIQETERKHIARELHDEFGQCLTAIQADASTICMLNPNPQDRNYISAQAILLVSKHMYSTMHSIIQRIRPNILDALGLEDALADYIQNWQRRHPQTHYQFVTMGQIGTVDEMLSISIYRIVQECLTNITKHAQAKHAWVKVHKEQEQLIVMVKDDGKGIEPNLHHRGLGLVGIRERAQFLSGTFYIHSAPGQGTEITFTVPLVCLPIS